MTDTKEEQMEKQIFISTGLSCSIQKARPYLTVIHNDVFHATDFVGLKYILH